jgi:hypothetical protein
MITMRTILMNDEAKRHGIVRPSIADQKAELIRVWELLQPRDRQLLELRAIDPFFVMPPQIVHFQAMSYDSLSDLQGAFEDRALELNQAGYNIYTTLNPVKPDLCGTAARDADILHRSLLLIDIDRVGNTKQPATNVGKDQWAGVLDL